MEKDYKKLYEEALERAKVVNKGTEDYNIVTAIFPELIESEDEKIRRKFIKALKECGFTHFDDEFTVQEAIAWLEKQGEQKSAWSEEDEKNALEIKCLILNYRIGNGEYELCSWIDHLKERVQPQPKWSEEDDEVFKAIYEDLHAYYTLKANMLVYDTYKKEYEKKWENAKKWLEKQGTPAKLSEEERNRFAKGVLTSCAESFINYLNSNKYEGKRCVSNGECGYIENAFHNAMWDRLHRCYCKYIDKSLSWSEKDEVMINSIIKNLDEGEWFDIQQADWLKSLKDRMTWKPTEEQLNSLLSVAADTIGFNARILSELYDDLKKL